MRKLTLFFWLSAAAICLNHVANAQQTPSQDLAQEDERASTERLKWINTGIFVVLLGVGIAKLAPKFFNARSLEIQKAIQDATGLKIDADFRYSEIDKKMSNLSAEVERMKAEGAAELERAHERLQAETRDEIEHMGRNADYEIDSLRKDGARQVKQHTAEMAFALAERRLQAHFHQDGAANNVPEFINLVESSH